MKLLSLQLNYFRQHVASEFEFPAGLVGIIGHNGAGKTSLVEAIAFALYGAKAIRGKVEHLVTRGAGERVKPAATLVFEHDGVGYTARRTTDTAELLRGGEPEPVARGTREVSERIAQILGMNHEEFVATYFTEQKGLEFLSGKKGAAERERFIVRMMGYDRLEKVQEALRLDRREKKAELVGWEASLGNRAVIEARLEEEVRGIARLEEAFSAAVGALERADKDTALLKRSMEKLEVERAPWLKLHEGAKKLEIQLGERRRRREQVEGERRRAIEALGGDGALSRVRERLTGREALEREIALGEDRKKAVEEEVQALELSWREGVARVKSDLDGTKRRLTAALGAVKERGELKAGSRCPTCDQELGDSFSAVLAHQRGEVAALETEVVHLAEALSAAQGEPAPLLAARAKREGESAALLTLRKDLEALARSERSLETVTRLDAEAALGTREIAELEDERGALLREIERSPFSEARYTAEKSKYDAASRLLEVTRLQKVRAEGELQTHRALKARTEGELRAYDERAAALIERRQLLALLDDGDQALTDFRKHLNASIRPRLTELASEFLAELTDGRYTTVEIGVDFTPTVIEDGEPKPIISGGEEDILNLCLRLALSNMLAERAGQAFSLLMLDEVFGSLDEGRRTNVLGLLEKLNQRFEQILVITHLDDIKEGVQSLIEIEYDDATGGVRVGSGEAAPPFDV